MSRPLRSQPTADLTGQRFGLVVVLGPAPSAGHGARWRTRCDCTALGYHLGSALRQKAPKTHRNCRPAPDRGQP